MLKNFQSVRDHKLFEVIVSIIIVFSAIVVGVKTYPLSPTIETVINTLDLIVTAIFVVELGIRYWASETNKEYFSSGWNWFDIIILFGSLAPMGDSAQVARVLRVLRIMRLISFLPELRALINSFFQILPQTFYLILLNLIFFYIYAVVGHSAFSDINPELWGDLGKSMLTLFRIMTLEGWTDVMYETMAEAPYSWTFYVTFIVISAIICLNLLIGIVVSVVESNKVKP